MNAKVLSDTQTIRLAVDGAPKTYVRCWRTWILPDTVELHYSRSGRRITSVHARVEGYILDDGHPTPDRQDNDYHGQPDTWPDWLAHDHHPDRSSR
ncbi:hypothetical protein SAZ11_08340 [Streptomyces sp. FXJ1.4098]|nr:hypothetical protein [Streptomyces sp. FXJ1.4098]